jgi:hypothetical protein
MIKIIGIPGGFEIIIIFYLALILLWVSALVSCLKSSLDANLKIIWVLVIIFLPFIGALLYFIVGRPQPIKQP